MIEETKLVTAKNLIVGQKIEGWQLDGSSRYCRKVVKQITPFQILVTWDDKDEGEWVDASAMFEVKLTEKEFYNKYHADAKEIYSALQNRMSFDEIGCHEMWNAWLSLDLHELAYKCRKEKIKIVGYSRDIVPKHSWAGELLDIGICAEYEDGERFWCHESSNAFDYWERSVLIYERVTGNKWDN